jgi:hypothetical protein
MHRFSIAILVVLTNASCFAGEFLAGTVCERDSECSPRYVCLFPTDTTGADGGAMRDPTTGTGGDATTGGPTGLCGAADLTPPRPPKTTSQPSETTGTGTGTDTGGS